MLASCEASPSSRASMYFRVAWSFAITRFRRTRYGSGTLPTRARSSVLPDRMESSSRNKASSFS